MSDERNLHFTLSFVQIMWAEHIASTLEFTLTGLSHNFIHQILMFCEFLQTNQRAYLIKLCAENKYSTQSFMLIFLFSQWV